MTAFLNKSLEVPPRPFFTSKVDKKTDNTPIVIKQNISSLSGVCTLNLIMLAGSPGCIMMLHSVKGYNMVGTI